jgi:hypothetical protein
MSEVCECTAIEERICVRKDSRLEEIVKKLCFLEEEGKGKEVGVREKGLNWSGEESVNSHHIDENDTEHANDINQAVMCAVEEMFVEDGFVEEDYSGSKGPVGSCRGAVVRIPEEETETPILNGVGTQQKETISSFSDHDAAAMLW